MIGSNARSQIPSGESRANSDLFGLSRHGPQKLIGDNRIVTPAEVVLKRRQCIDAVPHSLP